MKRLTALIFALILVFSACACAEAPAPTVYAKVTPAPVNYTNMSFANLYQLPGEYRPVIGTLSSGTMVFVTFEGSTWHRVKPVSGGQEGWIRDADLTFTTRGYSASTLGAVLRTAHTVSSSDGFAALRWGPGTYYDVIDNLPNGRYVWKYETVDGWARVLLEDGRSGFVHASLLKNAKKLQTWPSGLYAYVQVSGNYALYRKSPNYSSTAMGSLASGEVIEILSEQGSFYQFRHPIKGITAYISNDVVSPESLNQITYSAPLYYDDPNAYACDVITYLAADTVVKVLASDGYVSRIQYAGGEGYVYDYSLKY